MTTPERWQLVMDLATAMRRLGASTGHLDRAAALRLGVSRTDLDAMEVLSRAGPMTAGELARAVGLSKTAVTTLIDRMERAGYAERVAHEADRRRVVVRPTARGAQAAREIFEPLIADSSELYAGYSDSELALLIAFIRRSEALLSEHARRARSAGAASPTA